MILILVAMPEEAGIFSGLLSASTAGSGVQVVVTGMGRERAGEVLEGELRRLEDTPPEAVLLSGYAGGLNPDLKTGAVIFEDLLGDFPSSGCFLSHGVRNGRFHSSESIVRTAVEKNQLFASTGCDAVDMESGAVAGACRRAGIPAAVLKAVSDPAGEDLPIDFSRCLNSRGFMDYRRLSWQLAIRPHRIPSMIRLSGWTRTGRNNLRRAVGSWIDSISTRPDA